MQGTSTEDLRNDAEVIATAIYERHISRKDHGIRDLMEAVMTLNKGESHVSFENFLDCKGMLIEIACLLSDPHISLKISEKYYKENGGSILKRMIVFFDTLENTDDVHAYCTWYNLKHFSGNITREELDCIAKQYLEKEQ
jgi:hypothetical protein